MNERARRVLMALSGATAVAAATALVVIRVGRPLYYSDGERAHLGAGAALRQAPMLMWARPEPELELVGRVRGRAQELPDGSFVYGLARDEGRTELVRYHPRREGAQPEPIVALASSGHDLAPALAPDGRTLYFASDRQHQDGGGYDVWCATVRDGEIFAPRPLPAPVNTHQDETDPVVDPQTGELVFARRGDTRGQFVLWTLPLDGSPVRRLLGEAPSADVALDREPAFSSDGRTLFFMRQGGFGPPALMRAWRHAGAFAAPLAVALAIHDTQLRSPVVVADGRALRLLDAERGLVYRARAAEVYPWWEGQAWLERLLFLTLALALLIWLLLVLGRRWRALDIVTWCLIASLLLHLLVLLWLRGVEIVRSYRNPPPRMGEIEVSLVASGDAVDVGSAAPGPELAHELQFSGHAQAVTAELPSSAVDGERAAARAPDAPAELARPEPEAVTAPEPAVADAAAAAALLQAQSGAREVAAAPSEPVAATPAPAPQAARAAAERSDRAFAVQVPSADARALATPGTASAPAGARPVAGQVASTLPSPSPTPLADAATASAAARGGAAVADAPTPAMPAPSLDAAPAPAEAGRRAPESEVGTGVAAPSSALTGSVVSGPPVPSPLARALPTARGVADPTATRALPVPTVALQEASDGPAGVDGRKVAAAPPADVSRAPVEAAPLLGPAATGAVLPARAVAAEGPGSAKEQAPADSLAAAAPTPANAAARRDVAALPAGARPSPRVAMRDAPATASAPAAPSRAAARRSSPAGLPAPLVLAAPTPLAAAISVAPRRVAPDRGSAALARGILPPASVLPLASQLAARESGATHVGVLPEVYKSRFGPQKVVALEAFGGSEETEAAVRKGLEYLASIQREDGAWGRRRRMHDKYGEVWVGKSALCVLAFLGAGHTQSSDTPQAVVVSKAIAWLLAQQDPESGHFGETSAYSHGITTYALAECYAITKDPNLRAPVEKAVAWMLRNQNRGRDRRSHGGWGYFSPTLRPEDRFARASITSWMVMALKSAQMSGIELPVTALPDAEAFLWRMFDPEHGTFLYNREPSRLASEWRTLPGSTPASVFSLLLLGADRDDPRLRAAEAWILERAPTAYARFSIDDFVRRAQGNVYYWYYGSLACFLAGGDVWSVWNAALKHVLLEGQSDDGSFAPIDEYADYAGDTDRDRAYTTAMCVLSLEVYYRYFTPLVKPK